MVRGKSFLGMIGLGIVTMLVLGLMLTGCSKSEKADTKAGSDKAVTITFWHTFNPQEQPTIQEIVKEFQEKNPNIKIDMQAVPFADAQNKFITAAQGGNAPDVIRADVGWTPQFAALGLLASIDDLLKPEDKADYMEGAMAYNIFKGKTYGIPQTSDALGLLYNKKLFKEAGIEPPKTMDELLTAAQKLTNKEKGQYGIRIPNGDGYFVQPFIWAFGGGLIDNDRNILINNSRSVSGLQFALDLKDKYGVAPKDIDFANEYQNILEGFKTGRYAMIINGPWATADILSGSEFKDTENFGILPIPTGPDGKTGSPIGGHNYLISANSKNREAAYKFIEFLNSKESQAKLTARNNTIPTHKSAYDLPDVKNNRYVSDFRFVLEKATSRPVIPEIGQIYTDFQPNYQAASSGKKTAQQALNDIAAAWNKLLKK